jgi:FkbM family methyltransferase
MQQGQLWAFEPIPTTFGYLERNIHDNQHRVPSVSIEAQAYAIAETEDTLSMLAVAESTGWNRLIAGEAIAKERLPIVQVPAKPLDSLIPDAPIDLFKVDVEGA